MLIDLGIDSSIPIVRKRREQAKLQLLLPYSLTYPKGVPTKFSLVPRSQIYCIVCALSNVENYTNSLGLYSCASTITSALRQKISCNCQWRRISQSTRTLSDLSRQYEK